MDASDRPHMIAFGRALTAAAALALSTAPPVLGRADPPPPWGDPGLLCVAIAMVAASVVLSVSARTSRHRHG